MRDLDRLKEVREYRVTGPQLAALLGLGLLVVVAAFVAGFEAGLWRRPIDEDLMRPAGSDGERDAGEVLAALLAERPEDEEDDGGPPRLKAPSLVTSIEDPDADAEQEAGTSSAEEDQELLDAVAASGGESDPGALTVVDDTRAAAPDAEQAPLEASPTVSESDPEPVSEETEAEAPVAEEPTPAAPTPDPVSPPVAEASEEHEAPPSDGADEAALAASPSGRTGFTVQLAAYPSSVEAGELVGDLRSKGFEAFHQEAHVEGKTWYRVRVGVYSSRQDAEREASRLAEVSPFTPYVTTQP